ncbi:hypothetical protein LshimejAT787_0407070 [Lyophyllum shimeji]|uniref:Uncharacterized protein n=1 Tax=Lyophyllum shimeji TaxID=47721 RepID=A0A9P3PL24_LYOSH|nr:hypothetical protein LshimejAT787_0407070 [Lyophyllum shimeji]
MILSIAPTPPAPKQPRDVVDFLNSADPYEPAAVTPLRWEKFMKIMHKLGFEDSQEGPSVVRFNPPQSFKTREYIVFHKPYPDPTLQPAVVTGYARRLKKVYKDDFTPT